MALTAPSPNPALHNSPAEWARRFAIGTAGGVFMGVTGGFGTFVDAPLTERLAGWLLMFWGGTVIFSLALTPAIVLSRRRGWPLWFCVPVALILASAPMTAVSFLATTHIMHTGLRQPWLERYWQVLLIVTPIIGGYIAVREVFQRQLAAATSASLPPAAAPVREAPFLARLPGKLGKDLLCLEMEDHYVRAHTALGSDLILMRLRDAIAELEGVEGMLVHRSWWVARAAVEEVVRENGAVRLKLRNGLVAPVARRLVGEVRAAGW